MKRFQEESGSEAVDAISDDPSDRIFTSRLGLIELTSVAAIKVRTGAMGSEDSIDFLAAVGESANSHQFTVQRLLEADYDRAQMLLTRDAYRQSLRTFDEPRTTDSLRPGRMGEFLARWCRACAACAL